MKKKKFIFLILVYSLVFSIPSGLVFADRAIPPSAEALAGAWIGYEDGGLYFYRLVLEAGGVGSCAVLYNDQTAEIYSVDNWRMIDGKLSLKLSPKSKGAEEISLTVKYVDALKIELVIDGVPQKWERKASLFNEREFLDRVKKIRRQQ
jgi:hypothetical protein